MGRLQDFKGKMMGSALSFVVASFREKYEVEHFTLLWLY